MHNRWLDVTVFSAGMTTLAVELSASRLLGGTFGESNLVWATIIGLILVYLTVGYFLGGIWADRSPYPRTLYAILSWAAFFAGAVPLVARPVLRLAARAFDALQIGVLGGAFVTVLVLFSVPVTLLGTISPFALRLALDDPRHAGRVAGRLYAISTLGSFLGTFFPVLLTIPLIGTARTFLTFSGVLLLVAWIGAWKTGGWRAGMLPLALAVLLAGTAWWGLRGPLRDTPGLIFETESGYNYIQVIERNGYRLLRLNDGQGVHSMYHPTVLGYNGTWMQFLSGPFFNPPPFTPDRVRRIAVVGLAAGTVARQATAVFGPVPIDGFEIDPAILAVGRRYFGMTMPNLNAQAVDGRIGLMRSHEQYTLIVVDAYRPPYIPWHLTTREFFALTRDRLTADGVLAINIGRAPGDRRLVDALATTIRTIYPSVYVMDVPDTFNSVLFATAQPTRFENLMLNLAALERRGDVHPLLLQSLARTIAFRAPDPSPGAVFTDDRAPIEWITNTMILKFILAGGLERLQ